MAYTTIDDSSAHFFTKTYSGNGSTNAITNDANAGDFQPDWLWIKTRSHSSSHRLMDSSRLTSGEATLSLRSEDTAAESDIANDGMTSLDSNGFSLNGNGSGGAVNENSKTYVAWQWKANGGSTTSQTGSDINSVTQTNTTSKFSIITYSGASNASADGSNNSGAYWRVKHGLGSTPKLAIFRKRNSAAAWYIWHHKLGGTQEDKHIKLNTQGGVATESDILFGNTDWSSTEFEIGGWDVVNRNGSTYVAYMFDEVQGYSKFGTFKGNGNAEGPFIYTGFKPAYFIVKATSLSNQQWYVFDNKRDTVNPITRQIQPNLNDAENNVTGAPIDFLSNGIKIRNTDGHDNSNGATYIYIAFAEHPFVSSKGIPVTAR
tara:strand:+ start:422 stop:1543 length:1122 start_codon:yes stop_codon:yes gene_type:complete